MVLLHTCEGQYAYACTHKARGQPWLFFVSRDAIISSALVCDLTGLEFDVLVGLASQLTLGLSPPLQHLDYNKLMSPCPVFFGGFNV